MRRVRSRAPPAATSRLAPINHGADDDESLARPSSPEGTPAGALCRPEIVCTASLRLFASRLPHAYTIVLTPSATFTSAGPMTGVVVPAAATEAETVAAGRLRICSFGFTRPEITAVPPASTSTAGAAAT